MDASPGAPRDHRHQQRLTKGGDNEEASVEASVEALVEASGKSDFRGLSIDGVPMQDPWSFYLK